MIQILKEVTDLLEKTVLLNHSYLKSRPSTTDQAALEALAELWSQKHPHLDTN